MSINFRLISINPFAVGANLAQNRVDIFDNIAAVLSHNNFIIGSTECSCAELSNGIFSYYSTPSKYGLATPTPKYVLWFFSPQEIVEPMKFFTELLWI